MASDKATFSTPFARLGVPPEGCSTVHLPRLVGDDRHSEVVGDGGELDVLGAGWQGHAHLTLARAFGLDLPAGAGGDVFGG